MFNEGVWLCVCYLVLCCYYGRGVVRLDKVFVIRIVIGKSVVSSCD